METLTIRNTKPIARAVIFFVGLGAVLGGLEINIGITVGLSVLSMVVYFLTMFTRWRDFPKLPKTYGGFIFVPLIYLVFLFIINELHPVPYDTRSFNTTLFECVLLFFLYLLHARWDMKAMDYCLWGFAIGCVALSILALLGVGIEFDADTMRLLIFGVNPNTTGIMLSIGSIIILNDFIIHNKLKLKLSRFIFLLAFIPIIGILTLTGSRTAFLIFAASVLIVVVMYPYKSKSKRILVVSSSVLIMTVAGSMFLSSDNVMADRLLKSSKEGDLSNRDVFWKNVIPYITESPIWGYGETGYVEVSRAIFNDVWELHGYAYGMTPHNVILELLLFTGAIGLFIWLIFWKKIIVSAWDSYKKGKDLVPLLLCLPILACLLSQQFITVFWAYMLYAYILSKSIHLNNSNYNKSLLKNIKTR